MSTLNSLPPEQWPIMARIIRDELSYWYGNFSPDFRTGLLKNIPQVFDQGKPGVQSVGILSFAPNGFVREKAATELARSSTGDELPFLLICADDWVEQVRTVAQNGIFSKLQPANVPHFIQNIGLVRRLELSRRTNSNKLAKDIKALIVDNAGLADIESGKNSSRSVGRYLATLLLADSSGIDPKIIDYFAGSSDALIRKSTIRPIAERLDKESSIRRLQGMMNDADPIVRSAALEQLAKLNFSLVQSDIHKGLLDKSSRVRQLCQALLRRQENMDFISFYTDMLSDQSTRVQRSAIWGLGEVNAVEAVDAVWAFTESPISSLRAAAVGTLNRLDGPRQMPLFLSILKDPSPAVRRVGRNAIVRHIQALSKEELLTTYKDMPAEETTDIITIAGKLPKWDALEVLLRIENPHASPPVQSHRLDRIGEWMVNFNRDLSQPDKEQLQLIRQLVDQSHMTPEWRRRLQFYLL